MRTANLVRSRKLKPASRVTYLEVFVFGSLLLSVLSGLLTVGHLNIASFHWALAGLMAVVCCAFAKRLNGKAALLPIMFIMMVTLTAISRDFYGTLTGYVLIVIPHLVFLATITLRGTINVNRLVRFSTFCAYLLVIIYFYRVFVTGGGLIQTGFAASAMSGILIANLLLFLPNRPLMMREWFAIFLIATVLVLAVSRAGILALTSIAFLASVLRGGRLALVLYLGLITLMVGLAINSDQVMDLLFVDGLPTLTQIVLLEGFQTSGRLSVWRHLIETSPSWQITGGGVGLASFLGKQVSEAFSHPHNEFLRLYIDYGLIGLVLMLLIVFRFLRLAVERRAYNTRYAQMLAAQATGLTVFMLTDNPLMYASFFGIAFALLSGVYFNAKIRIN